MRLFAFVVCLLMVATSAAQPRPRGAILPVVVVGGDAATERGVELLDELARRSGLHLEVARLQALTSGDVLQSPPEPGAALHVWIDSRDPTTIRIYLSDGDKQRFARREVHRTDNPELAAEQLVQIVAASLAAVQEGELPGTSRERASEEWQTAADTPPAPSSVDAVAEPSPPVMANDAPDSETQEETTSFASPRHQVLTGYTLEALTQQHFRHGLALGYEFLIEPAWLAGAGLSWSRVQTTDAPFGLRLDCFSFLPRVRRRLVRHQAFTWSAVASLGVETWHLEPMALVGGATRTDPRWFGAASARLQSSAEWALGRTISVGIALGAVGQLPARTYSYERGGQRFVEVEPWPVRPEGEVFLRTAWSGGGTR